MNLTKLTQKNTIKTVRIYETDENCDFFIILQNCIFPLKKQTLMSCGYFLRMDLRKKKVYAIKENLDVNLNLL